jgi:hypothetical protein
MTKVDLRPFGFACDFDCHGQVYLSARAGQRLLFLLGENHKDRAMVRLNVLNACRLSDLGVVGCVGVEDVIGELEDWTPDAIQEKSRELFDGHGDEEGVIAYLDLENPWWLGTFRFAKALRLLRPSLAVQRVEDPELEQRTRPILDAYKTWEIGAGPHPCPEYARFEDHPLNHERDEAFIRNMVTFWDEQASRIGNASAAILNTGLSHSARIARRLPDLRISCVRVWHTPTDVAC